MEIVVFSMGAFSILKTNNKEDYKNVKKRINHNIH